MNARAGRIVLWGFAVATSLGAASTSVADANPAGASTWRAHGFSAAQRSQLREVWQWGIESRFVPGGAMSVVHRGEVIFREAFGVADLEIKQPFPVDAPCRLALVTKPYTATSFAMLVARKPTMDERIDGKLVKAEASGREEAGAGFPNPGGGLVATLDDVARLPLLHRNRGLIDGVRLVAPESFFTR